MTVKAPGPVGSAPPSTAAPTASVIRETRTVLQVKQAIDKRKGEIASVYRQALKTNSNLRGKVVVEMKIAPSGNVVDCQIVSSDFHLAEFEVNLLMVIRQLDFGAMNAELTIVAWPMEFFPT